MFTLNYTTEKDMKFFITEDEDSIAELQRCNCRRSVNIF